MRFLLSCSPTLLGEVNVQRSRSDVDDTCVARSGTSCNIRLRTDCYFGACLHGTSRALRSHRRLDDAFILLQGITAVNPDVLSELQVGRTPFFCALGLSGVAHNKKKKYMEIHI